LHTLSDELSKVLLTLQPQMLASRRLEADLCSLQADIFRMCPDTSPGMCDITLGKELAHLSVPANHVRPSENLTLSSHLGPQVRGEKRGTGIGLGAGAPDASVDLAEFVKVPETRTNRTSMAHGHDGTSTQRTTSTALHALKVPETRTNRTSMAQGHDGTSTQQTTSTALTAPKGPRPNRRGVSRFFDSQRPLLPDADDMKQQVKQATYADHYDVFDFYKDTGICQKIARSEWFDILTLCVIFVNAVWISVDADYNDAGVITDAHWPFQAMENAMCCYFFFEWVVRFGAFRNKRDCLRDRWFCFDSLMLALTIFETWVLAIVVTARAYYRSDDEEQVSSNSSFLRLVRLLRLCRIARLSRILVCLPELVVLFKGINVACRAVIATLGLVAVVIYVFAILFRQLSRDTILEQLYFTSIHHSMRTLLLTSVTPDLVDYFEGDFAEVPFYFGVIFFFFILLITFTTLNLLVGVLVNVVAVVANGEKEKMQIAVLRAELEKIVSVVDADLDNHMSKEEFDKILLRPELLRNLQEAGVDCVELVDILHYTFQQHDNNISVSELLDLILQLRGGNTATVKDIIDFRRLLTSEFGRLEDRILSFARAVSMIVQNRKYTEEDEVISHEVISHVVEDLDYDGLA